MIDSLQLWALAPAYAEEARNLAPFQRPKQTAHQQSGVGVVPVTGIIHKDQAEWISDSLYHLAADRDVSEIILRVYSGGGSLHGVADCYTAVAAAAAVKPTTAFIEDIGASAAYWIASAANRVVCNRTALVGSIGVYVAIADTSKFWEDRGVRWIIISTGKLKGQGEDGKRIPQEYLDSLQDRVDAIHRIFVADVARGRRMSIKRVQDLADGRVVMGPAAKAAGLVDEVSTFRELLSSTYALGEFRVRRASIERTTGKAAVSKYDELVAEETQRIGFKIGYYGAIAVVERTYPKVTAEAKKLRP